MALFGGVVNTVSIPLCRFCFDSFDEKNNAVYLLPCVHKVHENCRPEIFKCPECSAVIKNPVKLDRQFTQICDVVKQILDGKRLTGVTENDICNCSVCREPYSNNKSSGFWANCGHRAHPSCATDAYKAKPQCPDCREPGDLLKTGDNYAKLDDSFSILNGGLDHLRKAQGSIQSVTRFKFDRDVEILSLSAADLKIVKELLTKKPVQKNSSKAFSLKMCWNRFVSFFVSIWDILTGCCRKNIRKQEKYPGKTMKFERPSDEDWISARKIIEKYIKSYTKPAFLESHAKKLLNSLFDAIAYDLEIPIFLSP